MFILSTNHFNQVVGHEISDWKSRELPSLLQMPGQYCFLEQLDINQHAQHLFDAFNSNNQGESWTYLPYGPFSNEKEFVVGLEQLVTEPGTLLYTILDLNHLPIGFSGYLRMNPEHGVIEIGHVHFSKRLQKTPAATEAIYLLLDEVFTVLKYRRCEWKCNSLNEASKRTALRLGFNYEGTFRQSNVFKGYNRDTCWFSMLDSEWPILKEQFKRWLNPTNFDHHGVQKKSLNAV